MTATARRSVRCAIYTRVSTESGLDQDFNSLDAQYDAAQAYIRSQAHAGWTLVRNRYDDGGFSGGSTDRPALQQLLDDIRAHRINVIVVYKVDRLTRSLADFAKLVELFDAHGVSFVSVTQQGPVDCLEIHDTTFEAAVATLEDISSESRAGDRRHRYVRCADADL
jgi:site-specific DNA recombinase